MCECVCLCDWTSGLNNNNNNNNIYAMIVDAFVQ